MFSPDQIWKLASSQICYPPEINFLRKTNKKILSFTIRILEILKSKVSRSISWILTTTKMVKIWYPKKIVPGLNRFYTAHNLSPLPPTKCCKNCKVDLKKQFQTKTTLNTGVGLLQQQKWKKWEKIFRSKIFVQDCRPDISGVIAFLGWDTFGTPV